MWLTNSSIGRKVVMSISGLFLVLFLTFHMCMNIALVFSEDAYNAVCKFLGANWYALVGTLVLAAGFLVHIIYALWLTLQNRRARGTDRYAVDVRPDTVEWSSQNMFVLGLIVILFWYFTWHSSGSRCSLTRLQESLPASIRMMGLRW